MSLIKLILAAIVTAILIYLIRSRKFTRAFRLYGVLIAIVLILLIAFPNSTNTVAHYLGVQRGVDMLFYFAFLVLIFFLIRSYAKIKALEENLTELVREISLKEAKKNNPEA